ncbi:hypothetical protein [Longibaculum muris]|uniref:hypothetical protein n=1 Tax=Longibaculum muris TaxID=1796628 RepID=UPI0022E6FCBA|nr:hypothetical protein [Longibaculum muris]
MLKLMKYEFIHSYRTFLMSFAAFLIGCIIMPYVMDGFLSKLPFISVIFGLGFAVLLMGITIALFVSIFMNFNRSVFERPGYLTLTLPVSTTELIVAKVLTAVIWLIIAGIVLIAGFILMMIVTSFKMEALTVSSLMSAVTEIAGSFMNYMVHYPLDFLGNVVFVLGNLFITVGSIYFALTLAHSKWVRKHQMVFAIIGYLVLNLIIGWIALTVFGDYISSHTMFYGFYYIVFGLLLSGLTVYLIDHHIEIE